MAPFLSGLFGQKKKYPLTSVPVANHGNLYLTNNLANNGFSGFNPAAGSKNAETLQRLQQEFMNAKTRIQTLRNTYRTNISMAASNKNAEIARLTEEMRSLKEQIRQLEGKIGKTSGAGRKTRRGKRKAGRKASRRTRK